ncbi:PrsW family glutamic-type intramembrane protease [Marinifilum sp. D714]|uniref:PrsW family glutamic-type intramembrane protease n=1 Tax=Marinifilum sp. D714 TaxID=2937523 RepID=UPI0027C720CE|nr:PrsW family glutamic-type intramembrane protease [Marinifilum sp. D714]MDQ2178363.1 PrsW family glutamic-type intramembrane protease [Marinifilum sp. D714]
MNLLLISVAPIAIILFYVYYRDKYEKEPLALLGKGLLAGMITTIPIIFAEKAVSSFLPHIFNGKIGYAFGDAFLVAALCEEAFKLLAVYILVWKNPNFNERFDGIVYAVFVSLGFALVENIMYVFSNGMSTGIARAFTAVPAHAMFGIMMGYYLGLAKFSKGSRLPLFVMAFLIPFLVHGTYDFILMVQINWVLILFFPFLIYLMYKTNGKMTELNNKSIFRYK